MQQTLFKPSKRPKPQNTQGDDENALAVKIVAFLQKKGYKAWQQPNTGIFDFKKGYFRKPKASLKGVPDVLGFHLKTGQFVGVEIKINKDVLSPEQRAFLQLIHQSSGVAIVARDYEQFVKDFEQLK